MTHIDHVRFAACKSLSNGNYHAVERSNPDMYHMQFHHFLVTAYPHLPVGADKLWINVIPSFAHNVRVNLAPIIFTVIRVSADFVIHLHVYFIVCDKRNSDQMYSMNTSYIRF